MTTFKIAILGALLSSSSSVFACPHLEGIYRCPPIPSQGELVFSLDRIEEADGRHRYTFRYAGFERVSAHPVFGNTIVKVVLSQTSWKSDSYAIDLLDHD